MRFIQITLGKKLSVTENNAKKSMAKRYDYKVGSRDNKANSLNHKVVSRDKKKVNRDSKIDSPDNKVVSWDNAGFSQTIKVLQ